MINYNCQIVIINTCKCIAFLFLGHFKIRQNIVIRSIFGKDFKTFNKYGLELSE
jgi:hypothetical protein